VNEDTAFGRAVAAVAGGTEPDKAAALVVEAMTTEDRLWCLDGDLPFWAGLEDLGQGGYHKRPFPAARIERLGLPGFGFSDGPRGVVIGPATCFPVSMARGATWDLELEERIGEAVGRELRAVGANLYGGVCVNVLRHPAWGRAQETYGEDPMHVGEFGAALARGVQRHAMACVKHLACNSMENSRFQVDVEVDEVALHEVYLPHFKRIVDDGVAVVMTAYNSMNGQWCGQNQQLVTEILRDEWGFPGFVISDWIFGIRDAGPSLSAGLDVEMPYRMIRAEGLVAALAAGEARWSEVDAAVTRVVATLLRFHDVLARPSPDAGVLACAEHRELAREAAGKAIVLLRNEPVDGAPLLPLEPDHLHRVAVVGRLAAQRNLGDGGSSDVWASHAVTALEGLGQALPAAELVYLDGSELADTAARAATCDVALIVVGYTKANEGEYIGGEGTAHLGELFPGPDDDELAARFRAAVVADPGPEAPAEIASQPALGFATGGDRLSLRLEAHDEALIATVAAANPRSIVAIVAGSAVVAPWAEQVPALVQSWYAGMEGGHALADVLLGRRDAAGRLPLSVAARADHYPPFQRETEAATYDQWHGWWHLERQGLAPAFPFGFGLSYTTFEWGPFAARLGEEGVVVTGSIRNTGTRPGVDVVQLYGGHRDQSSSGRPGRRLLGFARVEAEAGEEAPVDIVVPLGHLRRRDPERHRWVLVGGPYLIDIARHAADQSAQRLVVEVPSPE
jgi:beta-glucosidase